MCWSHTVEFFGAISRVPIDSLLFFEGFGFGQECQYVFKRLSFQTWARVYMWNVMWELLAHAFLLVGCNKQWNGLIFPWVINLPLCCDIILVTHVGINFFLTAGLNHVIVYLTTFLVLQHIISCWFIFIWSIAYICNSQESYLSSEALNIYATRKILSYLLLQLWTIIL